MYSSRGKGQNLANDILSQFAYSLLTQPAPETEEEMMLEIFNYTERVVNMVRPRKLLFMAIGAAFHCDVVHAINIDSITDGVAPRAKMNQQRSRRFRTAQEAKEKEVARTEAVAMWEGLSNYLQRGHFLIFYSSQPWVKS